MNEFIKKLNINENLLLSIEEFYKKHENEIKLLAKKAVSGFGILKYHSDLMRLAVCLEYMSTYTLAFYEKRNIPKEIFIDTMKDIGIWCENNQNKGLKNYNWIKNHLNGELFKIGRLQYQFSTCNNKLIDYSKSPISYGEKVIYVHIPQGEKLIFSQCTESLSMADKFFEKYFSEYHYRYYFSESWLLYESNKYFMDKDSNIMQFQSLFTNVYNAKFQQQGIERIFGKRMINKRNYPENTTLRKNAKEYILKGGKLGIGVGIIDKDKFL